MTLALVVLSATPLVSAAPFRPQSDNEVLEQLPVRLIGSDQKQMRALHERLRNRPDDASLASELAERYYRLAQSTGDPRQIGRAQAVLARWPGEHPAPASVRVIRAQLAQFLHDFPAALRDLDVVLAEDPGHGGARAVRAIIHLVKADYPAALNDCRELARRYDDLIAQACGPTVDAMTGQAEAALATLRRLLEKRPDAPANERRWTINRLAEICQRLGRDAEAEAYFRQALALDPADPYLLAGFAEFLFDLKRYGEAIPLLAPHTQNDVLLLRLALAEQAHGDPAAAEHRALIADRHAASRRRGDRLHLSDEALYALHFAHDPVTALRLAKENWAAWQHEPSDARLLLEAALAARAPADAQPALDWLRMSGYQDARLHRLADQIARSNEASR